MEMMNNMEEWLWNVALKKAVVAGVAALMGLITKFGVLAIMTKFGIQLNIDPEVLKMALIGAGGAAFGMVHDWVKLKSGWAWL